MEEAQVWTLIGVLVATQVGALYYLGARIDALGAVVSAQGAALNARIDGLTSEVSAQGARIDDHLRRHAG